MGCPHASILRTVMIAAPLIICLPLPGQGLPPEDPIPAGPRSPWTRLEAGWELGVFDAGSPSTLGDGKITVVRVHPDSVELRLLCASAEEAGRARTARDWCILTGAVAAINPSMYQTDMRTSVSYMRTADHINNGFVSKDKTFLAFDPIDPSLPPIQFIDRECQDFDSLRATYGTLIQSIRMISCHGKNVWSPQERRWSTAALGMDRQGRLLLVHCRTPYSVHDFIDILLGLPLDLAGAMYGEGGPEAQLFVRAGGVEREFVGGFETGFWEGELNAHAWPVPNVLAIFRRSP